MAQHNMWMQRATCSFFFFRVFVKKKKTGKFMEQKFCYYCASRDHIGRECTEQAQVLDFSQLTPELIAAYDRGETGSLQVGDKAPDCQVLDARTQQPARISEQCRPGRPLVLVFGSNS